MSASSRSRRTWGWRRLTDEWAARVVAAVNVRPGELVLDIGAGEGGLAAGLALPRRVFLPPPQVDSSVLVVRRRR